MEITGLTTDKPESGDKAVVVNVTCTNCYCGTLIISRETYDDWQGEEVFFNLYANLFYERQPNSPTLRGAFRALVDRLKIAFLVLIGKHVHYSIYDISLSGEDVSKFYEDMSRFLGKE